MTIIAKKIVGFLSKQKFVIVSTLDSDGSIHCSAKGIVGIEETGKVYLIDLYRSGTFRNLKNNPLVTLTAVNEHEFTGYSLKGKAKIVEREEIKDHIIKEWEERVIDRISQRVIKNIKKDKGSTKHPESRFPHPQYLIEIDVKNIADLTPAHLK
jgi:uncharacterized pyridoxamine 5'-phosphate oxidase family protein